MLEGADVVAFLATTDAERARDFYHGVLGLPLLEEGPYGCVLDANGTLLRVTVVGERVPAPYTVLGWRVPDLDAALAALAAAGVAPLVFASIGQNDRGVWTTPRGHRVAWFADPDGNVLSLTEPAS